MTDRPPSPRIGLPPPQRFAPIAPGAREFWLAAADGIADWIGESSDSAHSPLAIVLPGGSLVATLQSALAERLGRVGRAWAPPPIRPPSRLQRFIFSGIYSNQVFCFVLTALCL